MTAIPYYHESVDFDDLASRYPPPPGFFEDRFRWPRERIRELQLEGLKAELRRAHEVPFYQRLWGEADFHPEDLSSLSDLSLIPSYTIEDIRDSIDRAPPLGDYQGVSWPDDLGTQPHRIFFSGGTTGRPRPTLYTTWDREVGAVLCARTYYLQGLRPGDVVLNTFSYSLHNAGLMFDRALLNWMGCLPISCSTGNVTPTERQIELAREYDAASVLATGDYLVHLADQAAEMGLDPKSDFSFTCFPTVGNTESVEDAWGVPARDCYGFHEVQYIGAECDARDGLHIWEDAFLVEVVDPETGELLEDGGVGDLVVTCLYKTGSPQIRFNAKDLSFLHPGDELCDCGGTMRRMGYFMGRSDTMVKLRGVNVWPEACGRLVADDPRTVGEYFVVVERRDSRDEMTCLVELDEGADVEVTERDLRKLLKSKLGVRIGVEGVPKGALQSKTKRGEESKPRRFEDRR